ncbi:hypothetical protein Tco_0221589 [Tanacetum coccineum]
MAQQVILAAQLVPRFHTIGRCNNYAVMESIQCSPECKIVGQILLDHPLMDMFQDILHLLVENPENPLVVPVNIETIEAFMNRVGYQERIGLQKVVEEEHDVDDSNKIEPGSHKDNPKHVDDDDDKDVEKIDKEEGGEMGSLETSTEEMQTPIPTLLRSPRTILSLDKNITHELTDNDDDIHSHHDDHQEDDAPPKGEKKVKRHKASQSSKTARVIDEDEVISEDKTPELITELQDVDKRVLTIFDYERMKATLNDALIWESRQEDIRHLVPRPLVVFGPHRNPNEPPRITEVVRITADQPHGLDFMEQITVMRENDKPYSFSEADFKYLNKNDIEDLYYLCRNKKLGIESYQIKVNLTAPTLTFPSIEAHEPYSIVDKLSTL